MAESTVDIIGKGFKFDTNVIVEELAVVLPLGTTTAFVGAGNWGPTNAPTKLESSTRGAFRKTFGTPLDATSSIPDSAGLASVYYLSRNPELWYTRITDGTDSKARHTIVKPAQPAKITGTTVVKNSTATIYDAGDAGTQNNKVSITFDTTTYASGTFTLDLAASLSTKATTKQSIDTVTLETPVAISAQSGNYDVGDYIIFKLDTINVNYRVDTGSAFTTMYTDVDDDEIVSVNIAATFADGTASSGITDGGGSTAAATDFQLLDNLSAALDLESTTAVDSAAVIASSALFDVDVTYTDVAGAPTTTTYNIDMTGRSATTLAGLEAEINAEFDENSVPVTASFDYTNDKIILTSDEVGIRYAVALGTEKGFLTALATDLDGSSGTVDTENATAGTDGNTRYVSINDGTTTHNIPLVTTYATTLAELITEFDAQAALAGFSKYTAALDVTNQQIDITSSTNTDVLSIEVYSTPAQDLISETANLAVGTEPFAAQTYAEKWLAALDAEIWDGGWGTRTDYIDQNGTTASIIDFKSLERGISSRVEITRDVILHPTVTTSDPYISTGANTLVNNIVDEIADAMDTAGIQATIYFDSAGKVAVASTTTGATASITIDTLANDVFAVLALTEGDTAAGSDSSSTAVLNAVYSGTEGNTANMTVLDTQDGKLIQFYFQGSLLAVFAEGDYSLDSADDTFIGNLMNANDIVKNIVTLDLNDGVTVLDDLPAGIYALTGGTSGINNISDGAYALALEDYKNLDLYTVDMIGVPGNVSEIVADKLQEVCEYRKDCFTIVDSPGPEDIATPEDAIDWHNGSTSHRSVALDSQYVTTFWPYIMIPTQSASLPMQWHGPSTRLFGMMGAADISQDSKVHTPAGIGFNFRNDIEDTAYFLTEEDKKLLYADRYLNNINPIVYSNNYGFFVDGEKTTQKEKNALNRIHTMRVNLYIKKEVFRIAPLFFFKPSVPETWEAFQDELNRIMSYLVARTAIQPQYDALCDATTNTDIVVADNGMLGTVEWRPVKSIEKIKVVSTIRDQQVTIVF